MALTSFLPFRSGYLACSAAQPAGAAFAGAGAAMPARRNMLTAAMLTRATIGDGDRRVPTWVDDLICMGWLLRRCHGDAMFQVRSQPRVISPCPACPGGDKKLDRAGTGFRQPLRNLWAKRTRTMHVARRASRHRWRAVRMKGPDRLQ